jgi:hypothetical protein
MSRGNPIIMANMPNGLPNSRDVDALVGLQCCCPLDPDVSLSVTELLVVRLLGLVARDIDR